MAKIVRMAGLVAALTLLSAAPAQAFLPDLSLELSPASVQTKPALTATISQQATDAPIERFTLTFPAGFTASDAPGATSCDAGLLATNACPAESQIGTFTGTLQGTINKTGDKKFGMYMSVLGGAVSQVVQGSVTRRSNGTIDLSLDELPALPLPELTLQFSGGKRSLIGTPERCGDYTLDGKFTSRRDELAIDRTTIPIAGCADVPLIRAEDVHFSDRRFEAGGSAYKSRTVISWTLPVAVDHTTVRILRRKDGKWRKVGRLVGTGNEGRNSLRWDGRLHGRKLEPGRYAIRMQPAGSNPGERVGFRILG